MDKYTYKTPLTLPPGVFNEVAALGVDLQIIVDENSEERAEAVSNTVTHPNNGVEAVIANRTLIIQPAHVATLHHGDHVSVRGTGNVVQGRGASKIGVIGNGNTVAGGSLMVFNGPVGEVVAGNIVNVERGSVTVVLYLKRLKTISVEGGNTITVRGNDVQSVNVRGSGSVAISGKSNAIEVNVVGSGSADMIRMEARRARVNVVGSGIISVRASVVSGTLSGSGRIELYGKPEDQEIDIVTTGTGRVVRRTE